MVLALAQALALLRRKLGPLGALGGAKVELSPDYQSTNWGHFRGLFAESKKCKTIFSKLIFRPPMFDSRMRYLVICKSKSFGLWLESSCQRAQRVVT